MNGYRLFDFGRQAKHADVQLLVHVVCDVALYLFCCCIQVCKGAHPVCIRHTGPVKLAKVVTPNVYVF